MGSYKYFCFKVGLMARDFVLIVKSVCYWESFLSGTASSFIRPVINTELLGPQWKTTCRWSTVTKQRSGWGTLSPRSLIKLLMIWRAWKQDDEKIIWILDGMVNQIKTSLIYTDSFIPYADQRFQYENSSYSVYTRRFRVAVRELRNFSPARIPVIAPGRAQ